MAMSRETVRFMQREKQVNEEFERFEKAVLKAMELSDFKHGDELSHKFISLLSISIRIGYEYFQIPEYLIQKYIEEVTGYNLDAIAKKLNEFR